MAKFRYQARDGRGEAMTGVVQATSMEEAGAMLRAEGKFITSLSPARDTESVGGAGAAAAAPAPNSRRIRRAEVISFAHQMAVMIDTGVPIVEALTCVADNATNPAFKAVLADIAGSVQSGSEFSTALRKYPKVFPTIMTSLIRASEASGTMGPMLERISTYLGKEAATYRKAKNAMMYPLFMMFMAIGVTIFLLTFVLPRFAEIYSSRQAALPVPTQVLLTLSALLVNHWMIWVGVVGGLAIFTVVFMRTTPGRRFFDLLKIRTPLIGPLFVKLFITRATRTMGTMINAGVAMLDMVAIVRDVTKNYYFEQLWDQVDERLRQGAQLSDTLFTSPLIPRSIAQMIFSGEKSGRLGKVMDKIAAYTEDEFDDSVKTTTQFIEPLMIAVMGGIIGFVAISLLMPIFSISNVVAGK